MINSSLSHLRLADLELFVTAYNLKSLGKAALTHNLSQSAASSVICRVEEAFERELCIHEKRKFRLTPEGIDLVPRIEEWIRQFRETVANNANYSIRIATTRAIAQVIVPEMLSIESIDLQLLRPDKAYESLIMGEADIAFVLDNAPWAQVNSVEIGQGAFQLYSRLNDVPFGPVLLPENQVEVLNFMQKWKEVHKSPLKIKARIPSWSLIADICAHSDDVGFLPDFLGRKLGLTPVSWQPTQSRYRVLALYRMMGSSYQTRLNLIIDKCTKIFGSQ